MSKTHTLFCQAGQHHWERPSQRGRPPRNCPAHTSAAAQPKRARSKAADNGSVAERLRRGREKANAAKRQAAVARVRDFRRWLREDLEHRRACERAELLEQPAPPRPAMFAELPTDYDYGVAREEGLV